MKIAIVSPIAERVPAVKYGGTETLLYELTEQLVKMGHDVTLYASGNSKTSAKLRSITDKSLREFTTDDLYGNNILTMLHIGRVYDEQNEYDIIHDSNGYLSLPVANLATTPVAITYHGVFTSEVIKSFQMLKKPYVIGISRAQTQDIDDINLAGTVHHGLTMKNYPFSDKPEDYLIYVGRISAEKGVHHAIEVAKKLNRKFIIAAKLDNVDVPYFDAYIRPHLSEQIQWIGEVTPEERNVLLSKAYCFLHPVIFKEPFGMTLIESMACGCPVVAFNRGSIPEVIRHGETGFVVSNVDEMIDAVKKINSISRIKCMEYSRNTFTPEKMAENYIKIYEKIIEKSKQKWPQAQTKSSTI